MYSDLFPSPDSTEEEVEALIESRCEISRSAPVLEREKKAVTADSENAAVESRQHGVKIYDWAYGKDLQPSFRSAPSP